MTAAGYQILDLKLVETAANDQLTPTGVDAFQALYHRVTAGICKSLI